MFKNVDKPLLYITAILFVGGLLILGSASVALSAKNSESIAYYSLRQLILGGGVGAIFFFLGLKIPYRSWRKLSLPLMILALSLLAALFIPELGTVRGGARRWILLGPLSFQPSELLKLAFVIYLASWLDARRHEVASVSYGMIPFALMLAIVGMFLIMQPDFGTLGVVVITAGILYFLGGGRISQIATLSLFGLAIVYLLIRIEPYRANRILVFLNPGYEPRGVGYQISQALIAIGSGGFLGQGFGRSIQKYNYLPEPMGDSIFAIFAEEMGFVGTVMLIGLFSALLWRGFLIAKRAPDIFGKLLAAGISIGIAVQAFINMAAISGLFPLTGIPLPFVSYGGTSLAITLGSIGILLNISKSTRN